MRELTKKKTDIIEYLDQLTFDYTQLCQRDDGTIYGIASGKLCRRGKPIAYNPNDERHRRIAFNQKLKKPRAIARLMISKFNKLGGNKSSIRDAKNQTVEDIKSGKVKGEGIFKTFGRKLDNLKGKIPSKINKKPKKTDSGETERLSRVSLDGFTKTKRIDERAKKLLPEKNLQKIKNKLDKAVREGKISPKEALDKYDRRISSLENNIGNIVKNRQFENIDKKAERFLRKEDYQKIKNKLNRAVRDGKITPEEAIEKYRRRIDNVEKKIGNIRDSLLRKSIDANLESLVGKENVRKIKDKLNQAVKEGKMTPQESLVSYIRVSAKLSKNIDNIRENQEKSTLKRLEFVSNLGGSTGAKLMRDPRTGKQYVLKAGKNTSDDHLENEYAADEAYRALGINVPKGRLFDTPEGKVKLTEYIEGGRSLGQLSGKEREKAIDELKKGFAADAILGNWDVVGAMQDNVLVDKNGKVWRIDNGGALEFRAKGDKKEGDQWNEYPTELWSMRRSSQGKKIFGNMDHDQIMSQIRNWKQSDIDSMIGKLPQSVQATMRRRIEEAQRAEKISKTLRDDQFKAEYTDSFTEHSMGLRNSGLIDKLSSKFSPESDKEPYLMRDENGKLFDNLRGKGSLVKEWEEYVKSVGGDRDIMTMFADSQAFSSWGGNATAFKLWFARQQEYPEDSYFWMTDTKKLAEDSLSKIRSKWGEDTVSKTLASFHAFTYEQLQRYDIPNNNRERGTFAMVRSIKEEHLPPGAWYGDSNLQLKQGVLDSYSMFSSFYYLGKETIAQEIPHHRVFGMYMNSRPHEQNFQGGLFAGDTENEALVMPRGISAKYIGNNITHPNGVAVDIFKELES